MENVKEKAPYAGVIIGLISIFLGVLILTGCFTDYRYIEGDDIYHAQGYAAFGSDYYTYSNNNMAYAAYSAAAAATQTRYLTKLVTTVAGFGMMVFGAFIACLFATKIPCEAKEETTGKMENALLDEAKEIKKYLSDDTVSDDTYIDISCPYCGTVLSYPKEDFVSHNSYDCPICYKQINL